MNIQLKTSTVIIIILLIANFTYSQNIELIITNIRSTKGELLIGVFKNNNSFKKEAPFKYIKISKKTIQNKTIRTKINLPSGIYGLSLLDDEDNDEEMKFNFFGYPLEGFGFSNYYHKGLSRPHFDDFKFRVNKNPIKIHIKIKYM